MRGSMQRLVCIAGLTVAASAGLAQPVRSGLLVPPASTPAGSRDTASVPDAAKATTSAPAVTSGAPSTSTPITLESRRVEPQRSTLESRALGRPVAAATEPLAATPTAGARGSSWMSGTSIRTMLALLGVVGIAVVAMAAIRKLARTRGGLAGSLGAGGRAPAGVLEVLGRYPVSAGVTLVLLRVDRRILLLSQTSRGWGRGGGAGGFSTLCEITDAEDVASLLVKVRDDQGESIAKRFEGLLREADQRVTDAEVEREQQPVVEPKPRAVQARPQRVDPGAALVEALRGQIPVVDLTQRAAATRDRAEWPSQATPLQTRVAQGGKPKAAQSAPVRRGPGGRA